MHCDRFFVYVSFIENNIPGHVDKIIGKTKLLFFFCKCTYFCLTSSLSTCYETETGNY